MKLRQKIILLAILPLIIASGAIVIAVRYQASILAKQYRASVEAAYLNTKKDELHHYVTLAMPAIAHLYESGKSDPQTLAQAKAILAKLDYGEDDGYFFIYDLHGVSLMHPRQPDLVGHSQLEMAVDGTAPIQRLLATAAAGGGFVDYLWKKPAGHKTARKLGYVIPLERWGWMVGAALYLDDIDVATSKLDGQIYANISTTMVWITVIAIAGALIVTLCGLAYNMSEFRVADDKLKTLAQRVVRSQEDERARLSRDLHDGISQLLVSAKLHIESGMELASQRAPEAFATAKPPFARAAKQIHDVLSEVRRISHDLRPALLDDLGLAVALRHLTQEFAASAKIGHAFTSQGATDQLSEVANTVLFRIAQEALNNVQRHARATTVTVSLHHKGQHLALTIADNGMGFDLAGISQHPQRGIGLRNMHERIEAIGGTLEVLSSPGGTRVVAHVYHPAS